MNKTGKVCAEHERVELAARAICLRGMSRDTRNRSWSSSSGGPLSTGAVTCGCPPGPPGPNRCSVRSATTMPCRASRPDLHEWDPVFDHAVISPGGPPALARPRAVLVRAHPPDDLTTTCLMSSSVSWSSFFSWDRPSRDRAGHITSAGLAVDAGCAAMTARSRRRARPQRPRILITDNCGNTIPATSYRLDWRRSNRDPTAEVMNHAASSYS